MTQRRAWLRRVAALSAMGGLGAAWWRMQSAGQGGAGQLAADVSTALWASRFDQPGGGTLVMQTLRGRPLLLNFWATWCPPCVAELPLLDRHYQQHQSQGWQVVGLAVDQPAAVRTFLQKTPLSFPVGLAGAGGVALSRSLGNLAGGLPFSVLLNEAGDVLHRKMGGLSAAELRDWTEPR
jgi:thiol-disulfide isomerase/thioredoxin